MMEFFEILTNVDDYILQIAKDNLWLAYGLLFLIIFAESGNPIFSFLPGDGLLLTVGIIASTGVMNVAVVMPLLILAGVLGFYLNYFTGKYAGVKIINGDFRINEEHLNKTNDFFQKHGTKALVISRFFPIVRSVAPFVAGMSMLDFYRFQRDSIIGAAIWVGFFVGAGYVFGNIPLIRENFFLVYLSVNLSMLSIMVFSAIKFYLKNRFKGI